MRNSLSFPICLILLLVLFSRLAPSECIVAVERGNVFCTSDLEFGGVRGFNFDFPLREKIALRIGVDFYTYDHSFTHWGLLQIIVNADVILSDYYIAIGAHSYKVSIKEIVYPYVEIFPGLHIIKGDVRTNGYIHSNPPDNVEPYGHSPQVVPGMEMALGAKLSPTRIPMYLFVEGELLVMPAWNDYLIGYNDDYYAATGSLLIGLAFTSNF